MDNQSSKKTDNENLNEKSENKKSVDTSVEDGKKAIDMQNKIENKSDEEKDKDAAQWRNEG